MYDDTDFRPSQDRSWCAQSLREPGDDVTGVIVKGMHEARSHRANLRARWQGRHPMTPQHVRRASMPLRLAVMAGVVVLGIAAVLVALPDGGRVVARPADTPTRSSSPVDGPGEPSTSPVGEDGDEQPAAQPDASRSTQTRAARAGTPSRAPAPSRAPTATTGRPAAPAGASVSASSEPSASPTPSETPSDDPTPSDTPSTEPTPSEEAPSDGTSPEDGSDGNGVPPLDPSTGPTDGPSGSTG